MPPGPIQEKGAEMRNQTRRAWLLGIGVLTAAALSLVPVALRAVEEAPLLERLKPDMVLLNGKIVTVDKDFTIAEAVAIKNGRLVAVGSNADIKALVGKHTQVTDLEGRTVLPGFIDPHAHFAHKVGKAPDPFEDMFAEATSIEAIRRAIQGKVAQTPPGELVWFSRGVNRPDQLAEKRWPTRRDLDPISPDNPVLLGFASDHVTIVNSALLNKVGIDKNTPQPGTKGFAGEIVKDPVTGEPTGVLVEKGATTLARDPFDMYPTEDLEANIERAFDRVLKYGITSVYDPMSNAGKALDNKPGMLAYQRLARRGAMKVRVNNMIRLPIRVKPLPDVLDFLNSLLYVDLSNEFLRVGTLKISVDGSGYQVPKESVRAVLKAAHKAGWQMYIHLSADGSFDAVTEALDEAYREFPRHDARHVITHAGDPTDANIAVLKKYGIAVEPQTCFIYRTSNKGQSSKERGYGDAALRTYLDNGIVVMTGTDQKPIGPLFTIWASVTRLKADGTVLDPEERITLQEAIRAVTIVPAWASFEENLKGSIEVGKVADLVVLGKDILTVPVTQIKDIPVMMTMVGGKWLYINSDKDPNQKVEYIYYG
jgi:predicted amidohydrolase YtcJ